MKRNLRVTIPILIGILLLSIIAISAFVTEAGNTKATAAPSDSSFAYVSNGNTVYATADQTLADVIGLADADSEILFLKDVFVYTENTSANSSYVSIRNGLTINLNGHTLYFSQSHKNSSFISVNTTSAVTLKNGTAIWNVNEYYRNNCSPSITNAKKDYTSYALFRVNTNNAVLNIEDIDAYGSNLAYSYSNSGITVNIVGGKYHLADCTDLFASGLVDLRANATVNISDALIDLTRSTTPTIFSLTNYKQTVDTRKSLAALTNCTIISTSSTMNILQHMNGETIVTFDGCKIYGSINPTKRSNDTLSPDPSAGNVMLSGDTLITKAGYNASNLGIVAIESEHNVTDATVSYSTRLTEPASSIYSLPSDTLASDIDTTYTTKAFSTVFDLLIKSPARKFTVTFYEKDGTTPLKVMTVTEGDTVTPPAYTTDSESNGWYNVGFDGWTTEYGGSEKVTDFTITKDTSFYPAETAVEGAIIPDLSGANYNLSFTGSIILNLYLPKAPDNVKAVKVMRTDGTAISSKNVIIGGKGYKLYQIANLSPAMITDDTTVTVDFNINGTDFSKTFTLSPIKYAKRILEDSKSASPTWSSATHTLIADMIRYSNELSYASGIGYIDELSSLLDLYGKLCTPTSAHNTFSNLDTSMYNLNGYVKSVQFAIREFRPQWIINLDTAKKITDVSVSLNGYLPTTDKNGCNSGALVYGVDEGQSTYSGSYIETAYIESMPVYNMDRDITITVTLEDGTTKSGSYNLSTYYTGMDVTGETLYNWQKFLQAFRAFASSSSGYKYPEGEISSTSLEKDFFDCDHANAKTKTLNSSALTTGRYCSTCQTYIFFYDDFINISGKGGATYSSRDAALAGKVNSYSAIDFCHAKANTRASSGYKVGCVATPGAVYYLGYPSDYSGNIDEITVSTDTQWDGAYIISDESMINVGDTAFNRPLFCIRAFDLTINGKTYSKSGTMVTSYFSSDIKAGTTKLPFAPGAPMMLYLYDSSVKHYIRNGANANNGANQTELILIDEFGNVSNTTPIEWDYTYNSSSSVFYVKAYTVTDTPIKISGLDENGNISATFENIANNAVDATAYKSCGRNIVARRSNVTIEGIYHELTEDDTNLTPRLAYSTFKAWFAHNVVFKDLSVKQHLGHYVQNSDGTNTTNSIGSYEFNTEDTVNVSWLNCKVRNFFNSDGSITYKGLFGTNRSRNMYLRDCFLPSFDAHSGAGNVTIENSTFEHINFIGAGEIRLNNVTVYQTTGGLAAIILRQDYGARWRGNVYFDGLELRYDPKVYTADYIDLVRAYYTNWDFGYGTAQGSNERPENIYANNVSIMEYSRKAYRNSTVIFDEDGKVYESTLKKGTRKLGIYIQLNKQLTNSSYDYSTINSNNKNPMGCTKNIYITNSDVTLKYPTHKFFKDMKIYIDGVQQNWY